MRGQINLWVGIAVALVSVVAVVIALVVYIAAVLTLKIFGAGGVEVVNTFNTPYLLANMIINDKVDSRPMADALLEASLTKDAAAITKISTRISELLGSYDFPYEVRLDTELGKIVLAKKDEPEDFAEATVPLMYKTQAIKLMVTTNER